MNSIGNTVRSGGYVPCDLAAVDDAIVVFTDGVRHAGERFTALENRLEAVQTEVRRLADKQDDHHHQMLLLHEHTMAAIRDRAPDFAPIRREFRDEDARLRENIERSLVPLEAQARRRRR